MYVMGSFWCLIVNFEQISHIVPVFLLLTLSKYRNKTYSSKLILIFADESSRLVFVKFIREN